MDLREHALGLIQRSIEGQGRQVGIGCSRRDGRLADLLRYRRRRRPSLHRTGRQDEMRQDENGAEERSDRAVPDQEAPRLDETPYTLIGVTPSRGRMNDTTSLDHAEHALRRLDLL